MSKSTCIYAPSQNLKDEATLLAMLEGYHSFSAYVWALLKAEVEKNQDRIKKFQELKDGNRQVSHVHGP